MFRDTCFPAQAAILALSFIDYRIAETIIVSNYAYRPDMARLRTRLASIAMRLDASRKISIAIHSISNSCARNAFDRARTSAILEWTTT